MPETPANLFAVGERTPPVAPLLVPEGVLFLIN